MTPVKMKSIYGNKANIFFAKDKESASARLKSLCDREHSKLYCNKKVKLARQQIPHISKWKTWEVIRK